MGTNETNENVTNAAMNAVDETVANAPAPKKNHGGAWKAVLAVVLTAGVVGSTTLSASTPTTRSAKPRFFKSTAIEPPINPTPIIPTCISTFLFIRHLQLLQHHEPCLK